LFTNCLDVFGDCDIELININGGVESASGSLCQRQRTACTGEHYLGAFSLCKLGNPKSERRVGENAGNHNFLAVK
jgi:hypothetical protein